jgi:hypothetical protein
MHQTIHAVTISLSLLPGNEIVSARTLITLHALH